MENLRGKVAAVTGAASGIGAGLARACASEGMDLALADVEADGVAALAKELSGRFGVRAFGARVDVSAAEGVDAFAAPGI